MAEILTEIIIEVNDQVISTPVNPRLMSGGVKSTRCTFICSGEWDGYAKSATFARDEKSEPIEKPLDANGSCLVPWELIKEKGTLHIGFFGDKGEIHRTANIIQYPIEQGTKRGNSSSLPPPAQSVYDEILGMFGEATAAVSAEASARSAADRDLDERKLNKHDLGNIFHTKDYSGTDDDKLDKAIEAAQSSGKPATVVIHGPLTIKKSHYLDGSVPVKFVSSSAPYFSYSKNTKNLPDSFFDIIIGAENVTVFNFGISKITGYITANNKQTSFYLEGLKVKSASPNTSADWRSRDWKNTYLLNAIHSHIHCKDVLCYGMGGLCDLQQFEDAAHSDTNYCDYCSFENVAVQLPQGVAIGSRSNDNGIYRAISVDYPPLSNKVPALIEIRHDRGSVIDNVTVCGGYNDESDAPVDTTPRDQAVIRFLNCFTRLNCFEEEFTLSKYAILAETNANVDIGIINLRLVGGGAVKCSNSLVTVNSITIDENTILSGTKDIVNASPNGHFTLTGFVRCPESIPLYSYTYGAAYSVAKSLTLSATFDKSAGAVTLKDYTGTAQELFGTASINAENSSTVLENFKGGYLIGASLQNRGNPDGTGVPSVTVKDGSKITIGTKKTPAQEYYFLTVNYIPKFTKGE